MAIGLILNVGVAALQAMAGGKTCVRDGGNTTEVCVEWSVQSDPIQDTHFSVDFSDPDDPDIELREGNLGWIVTSTVVSSGNPANIGDLTINPNGSGQNFGVSVGPDVTSPGAANVARIDLTAGGEWSGYSNINGGSITGNLTGDLKTKKSGSSGGGVTFTIGGNMTGDITADSIAAGGITITGDMVGDITIDTISAGNLTIEGDYGDGVNFSALSVDTLDSAIVQIGEEGAKTTITVDDLLGTAQIKVGYLLALSDPTRSDVNLHLGSSGVDGVPENAIIDLHNIALIDPSNQVDIGGGGSDLEGTVIIGEIQEGQIVMGGLSGLLEIKRGLTDYSTTFNIDLTGDWTGEIKVNTDRADADFKGQLDSYASPTDGGRFELFTNNSGEYGDLRGSLSVNGALGSGSHIIIHGDVIGTDLDPDDESIQVVGDMSGEIKAEGDLLDSAKIVLLAALVGDIKIEGDIGENSMIQAQRLASTGRILIDGLCDGDVLIQRDTVANSLIRMTEGLDDNGLIKINASEGAHDAKGDIHVGPEDSTSTDPVVFDGSTFVKDQSGTGNEGDLDGDITVNGCHATAADLNICIEGAVNGAIQINQTGCSLTVTHSCTP